METRNPLGSVGSISAGTLLVAALTAPVAGQVTERVSVDSSGAQGNDHSGCPSISADCRFVAFMSHASNLVSGDTNGVGDVFVRDRQSGTTERVSVDSLGAEASGGSSNYASVSADGRHLVFQSSAINLVSGDTNGVADVFVRDRQSGTTERLSVSSSGESGERLQLRPFGLRRRPLRGIPEQCHQPRQRGHQLVV